MPQFRRGAAEIEKSTQRKGGGSFGRFAPSIYWNDKDQKYLLFLNTIEDIPRLDMINFIPIKNKEGERVAFASVIARSDACFGEDAVKEDRLVTEWQAPVKDSNLFVALELEPILEEKRGRQKPVGFTVKLNEFERKIRDEDGNATDETETVVAPAYGFIQESASNFGAVLGSHDATEFPIEAWPIKIQRIGAKTDTKYNVVGYEDMEVDLTPFIEHLDGITYLEDDVRNAMIDALPDDPQDAALAVGSVLLEARLNELADEERYERLADGVDETLDKFGNKKKGKKNGSAKTAKPSQRKSESNGDGDDAEPEEKPKSKQRSPAAMDALKQLQENAAKRKK
jgi:hypothetical protein